ncbi:purine nucleoside phosphorylase-like [Rhopilema esculentum]|uniref:purine nucleoside phosphorylase-like n=1 Tax=Rhopilema esculentum TaxID=499914 RepID=UPI0031CE3AD2
MISHKSFSYEEVKEISDHLLSKTKQRPTIGIVCGSGLGGLADDIESKEIFPYDDIPGFPLSTVKGHHGKLIFGVLEGKPIVCMQGRFHVYEGHSIYKTALPIRVMVNLGIKYLFVTNAAGGINKSFKVGDLMVIQDHIGLPLLNCVNPLVGLNDERVGPRFPSFTEPYSKVLIKTIHETAKELGLSEFMRTGIYFMQSGPCFETPAEVRFLHAVGADAVGMSTVPEVVVAIHAGVKVAGISLITNQAIHDYEDRPPPNHEEVMAVGKQRSSDIIRILRRVLSKID